jgi:hypothetical protein
MTRIDALAVLGPILLFGLLYAVLVQPQRTAAGRAVQQLTADRAKLARQGSSPDVAAAITEILRGPAVGAGSNMSVETRPAPDDSPESTSVAVSFDAPFERIGRFFSNLHGLPAPFDLQSLEIARRTEASTHVKAVISVSHRKVSEHPQLRGRP